MAKDKSGAGGAAAAAANGVAPGKRRWPNGYTPEKAGQAYRLCLLGATNAELATTLGVNVDTINQWRRDHVEFAEALTAGKTPADADVAATLHQRALGFEYTEEQAFKLKDSDGNERVEVVKVQRKLPPDPTSMIFWLKNRQRQNWRDVHQIEGQAGATPFVGIQIVTRAADGEIQAVAAGSVTPPQTLEHAYTPPPQRLDYEPGRSHDVLNSALNGADFPAASRAAMTPHQPRVTGPDGRKIKTEDGR